MSEAEGAPYKALISSLLALRRLFLALGGSFLGLTVAFYALSPRILAHVEEHLGQRLAFFGVLEPFLALVKVALVCAFLVLAPVLFWVIWLALAKAFGFRRWIGLLFILLGLGLFYGGVSFCYFVTLPYGIKFLLSFQRPDIVPTISVGHFVNFVGMFLLAFGLIFELPLVMVILTQIGILNPYQVARFRRHAILIISILAAVLTPTPDVFNMALMGIPLYLLFETGLFASRLVYKRAHSSR